MRARGQAGRCAARVTYTLPRSESSARWARYLTGAYLGGECAEEISQEQIDDARLVVSELVTNATRYGRGSCLLRLTVRPGRVTVEVHDNGTARPRLTPVPTPGHDAAPEVQDTLQESGRGIAMVRSVARRLSVLGDPGCGKTVQAVLAS